MRIKSFLATLFVILLLAQSAFANISSNVAFDVRSTNGSNTNGGGFVVGVLSKSSANDLVVASGSALNVSSTTYGFTSADVGRWLKVTGGSHWQQGFFQIKSVAAGVATLNLSPAAVSTAAGSFTVYYGLDYSQQNSKNTTGSNISTTDLVTAGSTTITSVTAAFTQDVVGNVVYIAGGTGSITGNWYEITGYTSATSVTVDRSTGLTAGTGATLNIGGALQSLPTVQSAISTTGNNSTVWIKNEATYPVSATFTGNTIIGYGTVRGDNGRPTIQDTSTASITLVATTSGYITSASNLIIDCNSNASTIGLNAGGNNGVAFNNKVTNCGTESITGSGFLYNNETTGELSGCSYGIGAASLIMNNYVHDGACVGINAQNVVNNLVANRTGCGIKTNTGSSVVINNTVYNSSTQNICTDYGNNAVINNVFVSSGSNQWSANPNDFGYIQQQASSITDGNSFYGAGSLPNVNYGSVNNGWYYSNSHDVQLTGSPFVNASSGNYSLNGTVGAGALIKNAGTPTIVQGLSSTPNYTSYGAVQPNNTSVAGGVCVSGQ